MLWLCCDYVVTMLWLRCDRVNSLITEDWHRAISWWSRHHSFAPALVEDLLIWCETTLEPGRPMFSLHSHQSPHFTMVTDDSWLRTRPEDNLLSTRKTSLRKLAARAGWLDLIWVSPPVNLPPGPAHPAAQQNTREHQQRKWNRWLRKSLMSRWNYKKRTDRS